MPRAMKLIFSICLCRGISSNWSRVSWRFRGGFSGANSAARSTASKPTTRNWSQRICASTGPKGRIQTPPAQVAINTNRKGHTNPVRRIRLRVASAKITNKTSATAKDVRNSLNIIVPIVDKRFPCHLQFRTIWRKTTCSKFYFISVGDVEILCGSFKWMIWLVAEKKYGLAVILTRWILHSGTFLSFLFKCIMLFSALQTKLTHFWANCILFGHQLYWKRDN